MCFVAGANGVLAALTEPPLRAPPVKDASNNNEGCTEARVNVDTEEGLLPLPRCNALADAAAAGGAVIVTIVFAAQFTADVEL